MLFLSFFCVYDMLIFKFFVVSDDNNLTSNNNEGLYGPQSSKRRPDLAISLFFMFKGLFNFYWIYRNNFLELLIFI